MSVRGISEDKDNASGAKSQKKGVQAIGYSVKSVKFAVENQKDMNIENYISGAVRQAVEALYGELGGEPLQIQKTRREFEGDYTLVTFPLLRRSRKSPEATATEIGEYLTSHVA